MNEIVVYHNDINRIPLRNFTDKEINLFFSLLFKAKNEKQNKITIKFNELKKISNGDIHSSRFIDSLKSLSKKLLSIHIEDILENEDIVIFNIFNEFIISKVRKEVDIQIHYRFEYMLNDLLKNFTKLELKQLVSFKSSYSKNIYRLLKQFETTNIFIMNLEEFRRVLCIPESYKMSDIDKWVLKPITKEVAPLFYNFKIDKIKKGRKIDKIKITWSNNYKLEEPKSKNIEITKKLSEAIESTKKNRFITKYLIPVNIEIFLKGYNQEQLVKGLFFAKTQIQREFTSLNYLKKVIATGIEASEKVFKIIDEDEKVEYENEEALGGSYSALESTKGDIAKWCIEKKGIFTDGENGAYKDI